MPGPYTLNGHGHGVDAEVLVEDVAERLAHPLALVVAGARAPAGDVAVVVLGSGHVTGVGVPVDLARAEIVEARALVPGQLQHVACAEGGHLQRLQRVGPVPHRAGDAGGVENEIHRLVDDQRPDDVVLEEPDRREGPHELGTIRVRDQAVVGEHLHRRGQHLAVEVLGQAHEVAPEEAAGAGEDDRLARELAHPGPDPVGDFGQVRRQVRQRLHAGECSRDARRDRPSTGGRRRPLRGPFVRRRTAVVA